MLISRWRLVVNLGPKLAAMFVRSALFARSRLAEFSEGDDDEKEAELGEERREKLQRNREHISRPKRDALPAPVLIPVLGGRKKLEKCS